MKMSLEIRCSSLEQAIKASSRGFNIISLGLEGCIKGLPSIDAIRKLINLISEDTQIKIVLPFITQRSLESVKRYLVELSSINYDFIIVINDFGLLSYIKNDLQNPSNFILCIGRFLERSFDLIPWKENILRGEDELDRAHITSSTFSHSKKLILFNDYKIRDIELNGTRGIIDSMKQIQEYGLRVNLHIGFSTLSFSRSCPVKRFYKVEQDCIDYCKRPICLSFQKKWSPSMNLKQNSDYSEIYMDDENVKKVYPKFWVKGNVVLKRIEDNMEEDIVNANGIILEDWMLDGCSYDFKDKSTQDIMRWLRVQQRKVIFNEI